MRAAMTRAVSLFLTAVFLISSALTGTFAWQSISQTAKNENQGGAGAYPVQILKLEKDVDGNPTQTPVPGAAFYLFTKDGVQIGGRYVTDSEGKIHIELPSGDYYFEEIRPGYGFTFDADEKGERITRYPFTVTEGEPDTVVVTAYNRHLSGPLTVQKIVENADGSPLAEEQKQQEFVFTVTFSDEGTYSYRIDGGELQTVTSGLLDQRLGVRLGRPRVGFGQRRPAGRLLAVPLARPAAPPMAEAQRPVGMHAPRKEPSQRPRTENAVQKLEVSP